MEFPPTWDVLPMQDFTTASTRNAGDLGMELLAQARPNGRVLDHYRVTLGGSKILDVSPPLAAMLLGPANLKFKYQIWPRDVEIRRNMTTGPWMDAMELLSTRKAAVTNEEGAILPHDHVVTDITAAGYAAAIRFAVVIGEDERMQLHLQCLPASAATLMGKPAFRG